MSDIAVLIADAQLLFSDALAECLGRREGLTVLDERPANGVEALHTILDRKPDVALVDYWMIGMDGPAVARAVVPHIPGSKILHLSWFHGPNEVEASLTSGAVGFLPKGLRVDQVADAIYRAVAGESPVFERELNRMLNRIKHKGANVEKVRAQFNELTPREYQVLTELACGATIDKIARRLGISYHTARIHLRNIMKKTRTSSHVELIAKAKVCGIMAVQGSSTPEY